MSSPSAGSPERVVLRERRHWISLVHPLTPAGALPLVITAAALFLRAGLELSALALLAALLVTGAWASLVLARWLATDVVLTDRRVILRRGIVARTSKVIGLDRIQDITTVHSLLGRVLGFGRLEIEAAGASGREVVDGLRAPDRLRDHVYARAEAFRSRDTAPARPREA